MSISSTDTLRAFYRTKDGQEDYEFSFERQSDGAWRIYIEDQPDYNGRPTEAHSTNISFDGGRKYVSWGYAIKSLDEAKEVAALWADSTQEYIRTGAFPQPND